jgi:UDP-3-O-[3-hydroxymyristoyl] glucosamine N-acyltransferase
MPGPEVIVRVRELAEWLGVTFEGDGEKEIAGVAAVESAGAAELSFVSGRKAERSARSSSAGCLIVPPEFLNPGRTLIRAPEPRTAFARAVARLVPPPGHEPGIHPRAWVEETAELGPGVSVGPCASIAEGARIGAGTRIGPGCAIGRRAAVGEGSVLHAGVRVYDDVEIGKRAILHSGCVIGADGFGFVLAGGRYEKFPQVGRVVIGDDVEIGANSCVDRAALGVTWIGDGVKLDNLVHVAHNCRIGRHVVVAAQTGFSGGVVVEDYAVIGGQVGVGDKARIETGAIIGSGSGILSSKVVHGGQVLWGTPARPLKEHLEQLANLARLPELRREFAELKRRIERIEAGGRAQ